MNWRFNQIPSHLIGNGKIGGGLGIPASIDGVWQKDSLNLESNGFSDFYQIKAPIDHQLAAQKMDTLRHYYKDFRPTHTGEFIVSVEGPRVRLFYTLGCIPVWGEQCIPKKNGLVAQIKSLKEKKVSAS